MRMERKRKISSGALVGGHIAEGALDVGSGLRPFITSLNV